MSTSVDRRSFMKTGLVAAGALASANIAAAAPKRNIKKSLKMGMLPGEDKDKKKLSFLERFQIAKEAGFDCVEPDTVFDDGVLKQLIDAAQIAEIKLDAIICSTHWGKPLSDPDPKIANECMEGMKVSLKNAKEMGGDMVLLVPGVVNDKVMYKDAYKNSIARVKELAKIAEDMEITIGLENVWNKFLLSPLEMCAYIDEVNSPRVQAWFDVGNIVFYGYPQDWIRTLGKRIARVDIKDFKFDWNGSFDFSKIMEGQVNWPEVMKAFDEIGYQGVFAAEVGGGDMAFLKQYVAEPMDKIIAM